MGFGVLDFGGLMKLDQFQAVEISFMAKSLIETETFKRWQTVQSVPTWIALLINDIVSRTKRVVLKWNEAISWYIGFRVSGPHTAPLLFSLPKEGKFIDNWCGPLSFLGNYCYLWEDHRSSQSSQLFKKLLLSPRGPLVLSVLPPN